MKNEIVEGFTDKDYKYFAVNLTSVWRDTKTADRFIEKFAKIVLHEQCHLLIHRLNKSSKWSDIAEETVVRKLTGEKFPKTAKQFYK
jgi:predicted SprT family Zn-dependent metalloprotease